MKKVYSLLIVLVLTLASIIPVSAVEWNKKTDVPLDKIWVVEFNERIDENTLNTENIFIKDSEYKKLDIYLDVNKDNYKEVFIISKDRYNSGESYYIYITEGARSVNGNYLKESVEMEFITSSVNNPPLLVKEIEDYIAKEGEVITIDLSEIFLDEDGDSLIYEATDGEVYGSIYRYTVEDLTEPLEITIAASDGEELVYDTFSVVLSKEIDFEDSSIENAVREAVNKPTGQIYSEDVKDIEELNLNKKDISSLEGIQYLIGLKELKLAFNQIIDLEPLSNLINLEDLDLKGNDVYDIDPLAGLASLEKLELSYNEIKDISIIEYLTNLKELDLSYNKIEDVSCLSEFKNLILEILHNPIEDYGPIEHLLY